MKDKITFTLPNHTKETPVLYVESLRDAISEVYHITWNRHSSLKRKDKKDKDAGKKMSRSKRHFGP